MAKFDVTEHGGEQYVRYSCPGCKHDHTVPAKRWKWNGDVDKPNLSPSVRHYYTEGDPEGRTGKQITTCHYHIKGGKIAYCDDCEHALKGQTVELPDIDAVERIGPDIAIPPDVGAGS